MTPLDLVEAPPAKATLEIGAQAPAFEGLLGTDGKRYGFSTFADRDVLVLIFWSNLSNGEGVCGSDERPSARFRRARRAGRRHQFEQPPAVPGRELSPDGERATEDRYGFPYVVDEGQLVAKAYGPTCTFHVFMIDRDRRLRYQGRFDDARLPERVTSDDLRNAIEDVLDNRDVRLPTTRPFGCALDFV